MTVNKNEESKEEYVVDDDDEEAAFVYDRKLYEDANDLDEDVEFD